MCGLETWRPDRLHSGRAQHPGGRSADSFLNTRTIGKTLLGPHPEGRERREGQAIMAVHPEAARTGGQGPGLEAWKPKMGLSSDEASTFLPPRVS